jgi:geranylgeranyl transferase type-2 subunit beta
LATGAGNMPEEFRARQGAFLGAGQREDGGFGGRKGGSDLYYTSFALRGLAILGKLTDKRASRAAAFLQERLCSLASPGRKPGDEAGSAFLPSPGLRPGLADGTQLSAIDFISLLIGATLVEMSAGIDVFSAAGCDRRQMVLDLLARLRREDGGYAKNDRSPHSSTYHTFLCEACRQLVEAPPEDPARTVALIRSRQREDGGFVELNVMPHSGTNPTAAALGTLQLLDALDGPARSSAAAFLKNMQTPEGGLRANTRIPVADLLSTFTGLTAMTTVETEGSGEIARRRTTFQVVPEDGSIENRPYDGKEGGATPVSLDLPAVERFVASLEQPAGGFRAGFWDDAADVEYTFYGIGALALLAGKSPFAPQE